MDKLIDNIRKETTISSGEIEITKIIKVNDTKYHLHDLFDPDTYMGYYSLIELPNGRHIPVPIALSKNLITKHQLLDIPNIKLRTSASFKGLCGRYSFFKCHWLNALSAKEAKMINEEKEDLLEYITQNNKLWYLTLVVAIADISDIYDDILAKDDKLCHLYAYEECAFCKNVDCEVCRRCIDHSDIEIADYGSQ